MGNGDNPSTLKIVWLILVYIYVLMDPLVDDHPNIVQPTQQFIILAYGEIIVPNS